MDLLGVEDLYQARELLRDVVRTTPLEYSRVLSSRCVAATHLKCENLQRTGSFKIRGAYVRLRRLGPEERTRGVVAASAGNHAQGVALAAQLLDIPATVFMPVGAALPKVAATRGYGATVETVGDTLAETLTTARQYADDTGAVFVHPFDHPDIVAGQGSVGLEIVEQLPDVATVLVPTGGGGLLSGVAVAVKALRPQARVIGVQAAAAAAWPASLAAGRPTARGPGRTMADGIAVPEPGPVTFEHVRALVDDVVTVDEESLSRALLLCLERAKLLVEPAGAAAVAALLQDPGEFEGPVVAIVSGGNVDPLLLMHVVQHGLNAAGRFLDLRITMHDLPGELARMLQRVGELGANVIDVSHSRISGGLALGEVDVALTLETRGATHCEQVLAGLAIAGYHPVRAG